MSYTYLQEQGEESSAECFSDIPQYVLSRLNLTAEKSCSNGNETESCQSSQSGMMYAPSMAIRGEEKSMSFAEGSLARISAQPVRVLESKANEADSGKRWQGLLVKYDQDMFSSKTVLCSEQEDSALFSKTLPKWGMMQDGECLEPLILEHHTSATGFGSLEMWTTPCATDHKGSGKTGTLRDRLDYAVERGATKSKAYTWPTPTTSGMCGGSGGWAQLKANTTIEEARSMGAGNGGRLNPNWVEWLMGWPIGWTDLKPLGMDRFRQWLQRHSKY